MRSYALPRLLALALGLALCVPAAASAAEQFAGLTDANQLVFFRSDSPGNLQSAVTVTGVQNGEKLLGLSWVGSLGRLYALGSTNRIYVVNPVTGEATPLSNIPFAPVLNGTTFAFGVDPSTQQARSYSDTNQNLRISATNGVTAGVDAAYTYDPGDPNAAAKPVLAGLGYSQPPTGGGTSSLYAIDSGTDSLVTVPTQAATLRTIGALGVDANGQAGLTFTNAIPATTSAAGAAAPASGTPTTTTGTTTGTSTGTAAAYASISPGSGKSPRLYTIDLASGAATPINKSDALSTIAYRVSSTSGTNTPIISLTALGTAEDDTVKPRPVLSASNAPKATTLRSSGLPFTVSCNEACTISGTLKIGSHALKPVTGAILSTAGSVKLTAKLDSTAKSSLKKDPTQGTSLKVTVTDAAGNATSLTSSGATH